MSKIKNPLTPEAWARLKAIKLPPGRYMHVSCNAWLQPVPEGVEPPENAIERRVDGVIKFFTPMISPGDTYDYGSNKMKAFERTLKAALKSERRAAKRAVKA